MFYYKMMNFVLKTRNFALKLMKFALKLVNFGRRIDELAVWDPLHLVLCAFSIEES